MVEGVVSCVDCGHVNAATELDGELQPEGVEACPECGGVEFAPVTEETTAVSSLEQPDGDPPASTD